METNWIITQVTVKDKTLVVFYDQSEYGLFSKFSSDGEVGEYIRRDIDIAFNNAVFKKRNAPYFLNIASTQSMGAFPWDDFTKSHLNHLLLIYMPVIQKFIADARTDTLSVELDEETNPKPWMKYTSFQNGI